MTIDEAEGLLRASVRCWPKIDIRLLPSMGNTGQCPQCGTILDSNPVLAFRDMAVIFQHLQRFCCERAVGDGQGVKTRSYFSDLEEWLDHVGPFELVIDLSGATEAALLSPNEKASRVKMIGNRCKTLQKRFCHVVDGRDEERIRPFITAEESIIFSPPGVSPHHVALYVNRFLQPIHIPSVSFLLGRRVLQSVAHPNGRNFLHFSCDPQQQQ